jgi:hypothetical protein
VRAPSPPSSTLISEIRDAGGLDRTWSGLSDQSVPGTSLSITRGGVPSPAPTAAPTVESEGNGSPNAVALYAGVIAAIVIAATCLLCCFIGAGWKRRHHKKEPKPKIHYNNFMREDQFFGDLMLALAEPERDSIDLESLPAYDYEVVVTHHSRPPDTFGEQLSLDALWGGGVLATTSDQVTQI